MLSPAAADSGKGISASSFWGAVLGVSFIKLLFLNSYRSTDFEVHRNWLAITHSLPLDQWYYEKRSEWTLDYPPFFAYFEWLLSQVAQFFDKEMLQISNLDHASPQTILFQRLSVILVDFVLAYSVLKCSISSAGLLSPKPTPSTSSSPRKTGPNSGIQLKALLILIFLNGGLLIVDHIHFQYNGFLFGILLLSISKSLEGKYYQSALIFAILLNFKHIFLYMAPAFGVYFLRQQCFPQGFQRINFPTLFKSLLSFAAIGLSVLTASFAPFYKHIPQILQRLFPFQRGLSHAYWAPNFWAAYNTLDWLLNILLKKDRSTSVTSGLVGTASLSVLPNILPLHTFLLTLAFMTPALLKLWQSPTRTNFLRTVILTGWTSFMFGYHVHEKAILNVIIPFSLLALQEPNLYFLTLTTGTISLFPLLFTPMEIVLKALITILHISLTVHILPLKTFSRPQLAYLIGFIFVYLFENLGPLLLPKYPFLPLMLVSDYCLLGITYCYLTLYWNFVTPLSYFPIKSSSNKLSSSTTSTTTTYLFTSSTSTKFNVNNGSIDKISVQSSPPRPINPTTSSPSPKKPKRSSTSGSSPSRASASTATSPRERSHSTKKAIPTSDRVLRKRNK